MTSPLASSSPDPAALVDLATEAAGQAVDLLAAGLDRARVTVATKATPTDMVSELDRASEQLIVEALLAARPGDGIVAEEGSAVTGSSGLRWVVDPLDGTTNYLYGHPGWAVSIAAEDAEGIVAGVVADGTRAEVFTATRGGGARRDGVPIACSQRAELSTALVGTGFGYDPARRRAQGEVVAGLLPHVRDIRRMGAAAIDLCSVACGRLDAYYERGLEWWDLAAGGLIAAEAGAVVSSLDGGPLVSGTAGAVAAAPSIAAPLRGLLDSLGAQDVP
ncbi:MAG: inositol monophosphatase [Acidimicrobiales bacterium]|nr:inositol monophosphatase [Acidimicrobiales bacterium]